MWTINAVNRVDGAVEVESYATFGGYAEAREWADRHEDDARACGWTWTVEWVTE